MLHTFGLYFALQSMHFFTYYALFHILCTNNNSTTQHMGQLRVEFYSSKKGIVMTINSFAKDTNITCTDLRRLGRSNYNNDLRKCKQTEAATYLKWRQRVDLMKASLVGFMICNGLNGPSASHLNIHQKEDHQFCCKDHITHQHLGPYSLCICNKSTTSYTQRDLLIIHHPSIHRSSSFPSVKQHLLQHYTCTENQHENTE